MSRRKPMTSQFDTGELVTIFEDPITQKKVEGLAKLKKLISATHIVVNNKNHLERWNVEFLNEPGRTFERNLLVDSSLSKGTK